MARRSGISGATVLDDPPRGESDGTPRGSRTSGSSRASGRTRRGAQATDRTPAPESEPGPELTRRERRRRSERRRRLLVVLPTLAVLVVAVFVVGRALRDDDGPSPTVRPRPRSAAAGAEAPASLLLEHRAADGRGDLLTVVGSSTRPPGGSILLIPTAALVEVPSLGIQSFSDVPKLGEAGLLTTTVENLLGVRLGSTVTVDDAALATAMRPAGAIQVQLRHGVRIAKPTGEVILPAGGQTVSADDAAAMLTTVEPGGETEHLVTVQAVLEGWLARFRDPAIANATLAVRPDLAPLLAAAKGSVRIGALPVDSLTTSTGEAYEPRTAELARYVRQAFPDALLGPGGKRPRVEVLNGTGGVGVAARTANVIVPAGGHVTLTNNVPGFGVAETQVVYYRDSQRRAAEHLLRALGCGRLARAARPVSVVDVTVIVGADCAPTS